MSKKAPIIVRMEGNLQAVENIVLEVAKALKLLNHDRASDRLHSAVYGSLAQTKADMRYVRPKAGCKDY